MSTSGSGGDGEGATGGGSELGGGVRAASGRVGRTSVWVSGIDTGRAGVSVSGGVSISGAGSAGAAGVTGMKVGGGVKSGEAGMEGGRVISATALESGMVGMFGRRASGAWLSGTRAVSSKAEGTGMRGASTGTSEVGASRMGSAGTSADSFFADFFKPRKSFLDGVVLGGGVACTSSAVLFFTFFSFLGFGDGESLMSFSFPPLDAFSLLFFIFPSLLSFPLELVGRRGFLLSFLSSLKTTLGATAVLPSRLWLMEVSREGRAPAGR